MIDLFQAIRIDDKEMFLSAINEADVTQKNEFGQNLLHEAVNNNRAMMGNVLISKGVDVNHPDNKGQTPLHYAALHRTIVLAEKIVENGGKLNIADDYGNEPLWTAVFNARGQYDIVEMYVKKGADVYHKNNSKRSPLDFASQIKDENLIEILKNSEKG